MINNLTEIKRLDSAIYRASINGDSGDTLIALYGQRSDLVSANEACEHCKGTGQRTECVYDDYSGMWLDIIVPCIICHGTGRIK